MNLEDFLAASISQEKLMTDENIKVAFDLFDSDGCGKISVDDFYKTVGDCSHKTVEKTNHVFEACL
tara:strand:- start:107 stop:304 length:198 start_codon:yes stop_codon:yes gene_type:complete